MIAWALHGHAGYDQDNAKLLYILQVLLEQSRQYVSIRPFAARRNGREAYLALTTQQLGSNCLEDVLDSAEVQNIHFWTILINYVGPTTIWCACPTILNIAFQMKQQECVNLYVVSSTMMPT